jgi:hypothetical protein
VTHRGAVLLRVNGNNTEKGISMEWFFYFLFLMIFLLAIPMVLYISTKNNFGEGKYNQKNKK